MAKTMEHLSEFVFINVAKMTLARRDAHLKAGIKHDTLSALRKAHIHLDKLFSDQILTKAEEDIAHHENTGHSAQSFSSYRKERYHPCQRSDKTRDQKSGKLAWKTIGAYQQKRKGKGQSSYK